MKAYTIKLLAFVAVLTCSAPRGTLAQSTFHISLQDDNGLTRVSVSWSGDITNTGIPAPYDHWIGVGGSYINAMSGSGGTTKTVDGLGTFVGYVSSLEGFGTFKNLNSGSTATINQFIAIPDYFGTSVAAIRFGYELQNTSDHLIQYTPGLDSATVPVPFTSFNPGTYQVWPEQPIEMILTVVPEPSTMTLAGLACLGFLLFRRR
jgi:hypothetical protein